MALLPFLHAKTVAVMGLAKSGMATARACRDSGAIVWAWDDKAEARAAGQAAGLTLVDLAAADLTNVSCLVWSPGIPHTHPRRHPVAARAQHFGIKPVCDIDLLATACPAARFVGITGTNGKSTTTALIDHLLTTSGRKAAVGGNLGTPAIELPNLGSDGTYVIELSSYQLELLDQATFDVGVLLNITPDHLARHGGMEGYAAAKASLFARMRTGGTAVVGIDDATSRAVLERIAPRGRVVPISAERPAAGGVSAPDGLLIDDCDGHAVPVIDLKPISTLPGRHNWQNACASFAAARGLGLDYESIRQGLKSYPGLPHRQELISTRDGVRYINDSKATNADAAEKAMVCYDRIYWILGGQAKEGGIVSLRSLFPRVCRAFLIGEASEAFARTLADGSVPFERSGTLDVAVAAARHAALADGKEDAVVLLSPACASWDQFSSFEHRGEVFRRLVADLPAGREAP
jgi:UDP-N-acetylmuramoylalanine--D-glutamate ligase